MNDGISDARKREMDQMYAGHFYKLLTILSHKFISENPLASHAVMGACLKYAAVLARSIGMRAIDFRGLAISVFNDPPPGGRHGG
jgi:hypothetical protein